MSAPQLLVVGELNPDLVCAMSHEPRFGQTESLSSNAVTLGSSAAITACAAAAYGTSVALVSVVGDDLLGGYCRGELAARGVSDRVRVVPGRTGSSVVLVRPDGDRAILTDPGVMAELTGDDVRAAARAGCAWLHASSWFLHPALTPELPGLFGELRARGVRVSVDPNYDPAGRWDSGLPAALPAIDLLVGNEQEVLGLAAACGAGERDALLAARAVLEPMPADAAVVVKQGAAGATWVSRDGYGVVAAPEVDAVDTIGAGDTLAGVLVAELLAGSPPPVALPRAVAAASLSTTARGGTGAQPDRALATRFARGVPWQA